MKVVIIDDENRSIEGLKNLLEKYCPELKVLDTCRDVDTAYDTLLALKPDLIFLDIDMPPYTGFDLLKKFEVLPFEVIFVTAFDHYAIEAIKFSALYYLLKPIKIQDLKDAVEKAKTKVSNQPNYSHKITNDKGDLKRIVLKSHKGMDLIDLEDILYLKAENVYTNFFIKDGRQILNSKPLKEYEQMLTNKGFFRTHKSYMVNLKQVTHYSNSESMITISNQDLLPLSVNQKEEFLKLF